MRGSLLVTVLFIYSITHQYNFYKILTNWEFIHLTLFNGLFLIHPLFMLFFYAIGITTSVLDPTLIGANLKTTQFLKLLFQTGFVAVFLGSW